MTKCCDERRGGIQCCFIFLLGTRLTGLSPLLLSVDVAIISLHPSIKEIQAPRQDPFQINKMNRFRQAIGLLEWCTSLSLAICYEITYRVVKILHCMGNTRPPTVWEIENGGRAPQTAGLLNTLCFLLNMSLVCEFFVLWNLYVNLGIMS
jgi:hypothetical protein